MAVSIKNFARTRKIDNNADPELFIVSSNVAATIYHNPKCSKSRQTLELLRERGVAPHVVEYLKTPPGAEELRVVLAKLGMRPSQLLRRKEAAEVGLTNPDLSDDALIEGMARHPAVIERPIVVVGDKAALGRPPEAVLALLDPAT